VVGEAAVWVASVVLRGVELVVGFGVVELVEVVEGLGFVDVSNSM